MNLLERLFVIPRSLTGPGVRETIAVINEELGGILNVHEIPSGTKVFDWIVPREWRFHRARMVHESGRVVFDTDSGDSALHVVGYSAPTDAKIIFPGTSWDEEHLHVGPREMPDAVPYVTACYADPPTWGVCLSHNQYRSFEGGVYHVHIESEFLSGGSLTLAEAFIPGETEDEIVLSAYVCHAAGLANNECSGPVVLTELVKWWRQEPRRHGLRVLLAPETIGVLVYLASWDSAFHEWKTRVKAGFTLTCMGGNGSFCIQNGREPNYAGQMAIATLPDANVLPWGRRVSDERQWCAPGIDLPWATIMKTHPEDPDYVHRYHTSADDLSYVTEGQLRESVEAMKRILTAIEADRRWNTTVVGEPQLGRRSLYENVSKVGSSAPSRRLLDVLSYCDGRTTLDIAETLHWPLSDVHRQIHILADHDLIKEETSQKGGTP